MENCYLSPLKEDVILAANAQVDDFNNILNSAEIKTEIQKILNGDGLSNFVSNIQIR